MMMVNKIGEGRTGVLRQIQKAHKAGAGRAQLRGGPPTRSLEGRRRRRHTASQVAPVLTIQHHHVSMPLSQASSSGNEPRFGDFQSLGVMVSHVSSCSLSIGQYMRSRVSEDRSIEGSLFVRRTATQQACTAFATYTRSLPPFSRSIS